MYSRRLLLAVGALAPLVSPHVVRAQASRGEMEAEIKKWIADNKGEGYFDGPNVPEPQRGTLELAPDDARVRRAADLLAGVPVGVPPLRAAKWMIDNMDKVDTMEWPPDTPTERKPANPMIVAFFAATRTKPTQGDQTAWCAAFANWVLSHVGLPSTRSAGAVSFRNYGERTDDPKPGDIACFVNTADPRFGHVGFFDGWVGTSRDVMNLCGGNQKNRLMVSRFEKENGQLKLNSFRTVPGLRLEGAS